MTVPVCIAIASVPLLMAGCVAATVTSTAVSATATAVGTAADVAGGAVDLAIPDGEEEED